MTGDQHIVVVDDEEPLRASVAEYLALQGYRVSAVASGAALRALLEESGSGGAVASVGLVLLDLRMPGEDGLEVLKGLRERRPGLPVIMVTAMGDPVDRIVGLELGADDYVVKPFEMRELLARIRSVLRRTRSSEPLPPPAALPAASTASAAPASVAAAGTMGAARGGGSGGRVVRVGCRLLDLDARRLFALSGEEIPLTSMELDLLKVLVANANRVLSRDQLLDLAHNDSWEPFDRSIDIRIARLRRKIERDPSKPEAIRTVRGIGYMLVPADAGPQGDAGRW